MSRFVTHSFHLVDESPWPLVSALGALFLVSGLAQWFAFEGEQLLLWGLSLVFLVMMQWWRDISSEGAHQGLHTGNVELGLRWGMALFIVSEILFFFSFFWAFFHSSLSPTVELGMNWPPAGVLVFSPWGVPLLNTLILLSSGVTVTWAHHALMEGSHKEASHSLLITIALGGYFTALQAFEYLEASFSMAEGVYGSTFFIATGFHGFHVLVGTSFLLFCWVRLSRGHLSPLHHFGFEAAAWYWHFVDVVWLFLFVSIYWWGGA